jgi:protein involved in polysaccharide export with SLBB domain
MQPVRLGAGLWCLLAITAAGNLSLGILASAQTNLETQQQANDRIKQLSHNAVSPSRDYVIGRGDVVGVEVFDIPELSREVRVSQSGTIGIPLVPVRLYVAGLTELQLQQKIAEVLEANGLVSSPQVMVSVKEKKSNTITIVGAVVHPLVYQADRQVTLVQALAEAGGIAPDAGDTVIVTRTDTGAAASSNSNEPPEIGVEDAIPAGNPGAAAAKPVPADATSSKSPSSTQQNSFPSAEKVTANGAGDTATSPPPISANDAAPVPAANTITVNLSELLERGDVQNNIALQGGDIVTVPHAGIVYALGAVQRPGGFVSSNDRARLSTLKVLALAGGLTSIAKRDQAVIIRKDALGNQQSIPVDLAKIIQRKSEDVRLMPSDILYIPDNKAKAALVRAAEIGIAIGTALTVYRLGTR